MKVTRLFLTMAVLGGLLAVSCNSNKSDKQPQQEVSTPKAESKPEATPAPVETATKVDLSNKGVGPVKTIVLEPVNQALASEGQEIFKNMCTACHKPTKRFIGPAPQGVLDRHSPEWVMNMILNPEQMLKEDAVAQELLKEYNGAPMANQHLTEDQARAVLEYFRTL